MNEIRSVMSDDNDQLIIHDRYYVKYILKLLISINLG